MALIDPSITSQNYYTGNNSQLQNYQFISLVDIINQFMIGYVGEDKIISKVKRSDVGFFAQRAMQELSFDTFKSCKSMEIDLPASLQMTIPQDYVNWTKISWSDDSGIKHRLYPTNCKTSNPFRPQQDDDGDFVFDTDGSFIESGNLLTNSTLQAGQNATPLTSGWYLNYNIENNNSQFSAVVTAADTAADPITNSVGWFHTTHPPQANLHSGQNKIIGYNLPDKHGFQMRNLPILSGEKYQITFTLSGYSSGTYEWIIVDENQNYKYGTQVSADGTYTQEIDLSTGITRTNTFPARSIGFRQNGSTAGNVTIDNIELIRVGWGDESTTWGNYSSTTPSENNDDYEDETYWKLNGERYGLDPQHAPSNGSFYVDCDSGKIHFSSNLSGKTIVLDYLSDGLGTNEEMKVHKFAEEAMYKHIAYAVLSTRINTPEYVIARFKKERFAEIRKAKLRLSNIKLEEITQVFRGKSKWIKH